MADRSIATTDTLAVFRRELNGTAADVGNIADVLSASGYIASATDVVEAIVLLNTELPEIKTDSFIFPGRTMIFEGATDDDFETTLTFTEPTGDRTHTLPNASGSILLETNADTSTNKTITTPTITSAVLNTAVSGSAVLDEDNLASDSATKVATQQSIKAYVDDKIQDDMDIAFAGDSGSGSITSDETLTTPIINAMTFSSGQTTAGMNIGANGIVFEGSTADAHETTLVALDPNADNTITIPNSTMTAITTGSHASKGEHIVRVIALG